MSYDEEFFNELFEDAQRKSSQKRITELASFPHTVQKEPNTLNQQQEEDIRYIFVS